MREVYRPDCLPAVFALMHRCPDALFMAGGTDLLVRLRREKTADCRPLALLEHVTELQELAQENGHLSIGAAVSLSRLADDPLVARYAPLLAQACRTVGGPALRNMATLGGNIVTASPAGDTLPPLYLLDAQLELASPGGLRRLPIERFITGPGQTDLRTGEVVTRVLVPRQSDGLHSVFEKIGLRRSLAVAVASFAGLLRFSPDGVVEEARFAWGSVAPTVVRFHDLEECLVGTTLAPPVIRELAASVKRGVRPIDDLRATAAYRRSVAANLFVRFLDGVHG